MRYYQSKDETLIAQNTTFVKGSYSEIDFEKALDLVANEGKRMICVVDNSSIAYINKYEVWFYAGEHDVAFRRTKRSITAAMKGKRIVTSSTKSAYSIIEFKIPPYWEKRDCIPDFFLDYECTYTFDGLFGGGTISSDCEIDAMEMKLKI